MWTRNGRPCGTNCGGSSSRALARALDPRHAHVHVKSQNSRDLRACMQKWRPARCRYRPSPTWWIPAPTTSARPRRPAVDHYHPWAGRGRARRPRGRRAPPRPSLTSAVGHVAATLKSSISHLRRGKAARSLTLLPSSPPTTPPLSAFFPALGSVLNLKSQIHVPPRSPPHGNRRKHRPSSPQRRCRR